MNGPKLSFFLKWYLEEMRRSKVDALTQKAKLGDF